VKTPFIPHDEMAQEWLGYAAMERHAQEESAKGLPRIVSMKVEDVPPRD
jgi:hypothetical protein